MTSRSQLQAVRVPESWSILLDAVPAAVLIVTPDGTISFANRQLEELTGYQRDELCGGPVEVLVPEGSRQTHEPARAAYGQTPATRPMGTGLEIACRKADGTVFPADQPLTAGGRR